MENFKKQLSMFMQKTPVNKKLNDKRDVKQLPKNIKDWLKNG